MQKSNNSGSGAITTPLERIEQAMKALTSNNIAIHTVYVLDNIAFRTSYPMKLGGDKHALLKQSKQAAKDNNLEARFEGEKVVAGYMLEVKHKNQCICIVLTSSIMRDNFVKTNGFSLVGSKDTKQQFKKEKKKVIA